MTCRKFKFASIIAFLVISATALQSGFAQNRTFHIGSGQSGTNFYNSLAAMYEDGIVNLVSGDTVILYQDDSSLNPETHGSDGIFNVNGEVNFISSVEGEQRILSAQTSTESRLRLFDVQSTGVLNLSEDFTIYGVNSPYSGTIALYGGILNAEGVSFINNTSISFGGAIDTYGSTQMVNVRGATFIGNTGGRGGGVEIFYTDAADFTNATFLNNTATSEPGGAIFITGGGGTTEITMGATIGMVSLYEGNRYQDMLNSLHCTGEGTYNISIITETGNEYLEAGHLDMRDPIYLRPGYEYVVNINKTGGGLWSLGGVTEINTGSGTAEITVSEGRLRLYENAEILMTGGNDKFLVRSGAETYIMGGNTIQGTTVTFEGGGTNEVASTLTFDMDFYNSHTEDIPMLFLEGEKLSVAGTYINANFSGDVRHGDYVLVQGANALDAGQFVLRINDELIDVSGKVSERYGYALNNRIDETMLVLSIGDVDNTIVYWQDVQNNNEWSLYVKNWLLPYREGEIDSYVDGDTAVFDLSGDHVITIVNKDASIGANAETGENFYRSNNIGMRVTGDGNWTFQGLGITDRYNPENPNEQDKAGLYFDGTGTLTLANSSPNTFHGETTVAGGGTLAVARADLLGLSGVRFQNNLDNTLYFTTGATMDLRIFTATGGKGLVTVRDGALLTFTNPNEMQTGGSVYAVGGTLSFQGKSSTSSAIRFVDNRADRGGAIYGENSSIHLQNVVFENNTAATQGGAIYFSGRRSSVLTIEAAAGQSSLFEGNTAADQLNSIYVDGATVSVDAGYGGVVDMRDPMAGAGAKVEKNGQGTWKLAGQNAFTGSNEFVIKEGTLALYGEKSAASGLDYGKLDIAGTFSIESGGILLVEGGNVVSATNIALAENATLAFNMNGTQPNNGILLEMNGTNWNMTNWNTTKNIDLHNIDLTLIDGGQQSKRYNLMTLNNASITGGIQSGALNVRYNGVDISKLRQNFAQLVYDQNTLSVDLSSPIVGMTVWNPTGEDRSWNLVDRNWSGTDQGDGDLTGTTQFFSGDAVLFTDTGAGYVDVDGKGVLISDQQSGTLAGMTVNNGVGSNYIFQGGGIGGNARFEKEGDGSVIFANSNTFTNGSQIKAGTVTARKVDSLGTGEARVDSGATLILDILSGDGGTLTHHLSGNGTLQKIGSGSATLLGSNSGFTGTVRIRGGELVFTALNALGSSEIDTGADTASGRLAFENVRGIYDKRIFGSGGVRVGNGSELTFSNANNSYAGRTIVDEGGKLTVEKLSSVGTGDLKIDGTLVLQLDQATDLENRTIQGTGTVQKRGIGTITIVEENDLFSGIFKVSEGGLVLENGEGLSAATLHHDGSRLSFGRNTTVTLGGLAGSKNIQLNNDLGETVDLILNGNGNENAYTGSLSGEGSVTKLGDGTQKLLGINTYTGGTKILGGKLIFGSADALGSGTVENEGVLGFEITGTGTIDQLLTGSGGVEKSGSGTLNLQGENTYLGGTVVREGTLSVGTLKTLGMQQVGQSDTAGDVRIEKGATLEVNIGPSVTDKAGNTFLAGLEGSGTLLKKGNGSLFIQEETGLDGQIVIRGGTLYINGKTAAEVIADYGGTLAGTGWVDNSVLIRDGAFHRVDVSENGPLGTFNAKSIEYQGGSTVYVKIGKNGADRIVASDSLNFASNGGVVEVVLINLGLEADESGEGNRHYEIFSAESGQLLLNGTKIRNGESDSDVLKVAGVNGEVRFLADREDGLNVTGYEVSTSGTAGKSLFLDVSMVGGATGSGAYLNGNHVATMSGIGDAKLFDVIYQYDRSGRGGVIDQLMPMIQTAMPYMTQRAVTQFNMGTFERLRYLQETGQQLRAAAGDGDKELYRANGSRTSVANAIWFQNYGDFVSMRANGDIPEFRADSYGFNLGYDRKVHYRSTVGFGMGGNFASIRADQGRQKGDVDSFLIAVYGDWVDRDQVTYSVSTGFVFSDYDLTRSLPAFQSQATSQHDGTTYFLSGEIRKKFLFGRTELTPFFGLDMICLHEEKYNERVTGDPSVALHLNKRNTFSILSNVGFRLGRTYYPIGGNQVTPSAYIAWVHDWNKSDVYARASFAGQPSFRIRGASMFRDRAQVGVNLNMNLYDRLDIFGRFNAELGDHLSDLSVHWGFRLGF